MAFPGCMEDERGNENVKRPFRLKKMSLLKSIFFVLKCSEIDNQIKIEFFNL
jgi:hypothetical protein